MSTIISPVVITQNTPGRVRGSSFTSGVLGKFLKGEPKALGAVEIMIGIFTVVSGIAVSNFASFFLYSSIAFWGPLIYIIAGSLAVAAGNKLHPCLVKGSLGMNVISSLTAGLTICVLITDLLLAKYCNLYYFYYNKPLCLTGMSYLLLMMMLILTVLQFCICISISAFGCKATCCT